MKHKTYIAALLAGMLVLAGCGGGGSAGPVVNNPPLSQADCDDGTLFSEGACRTEEEIADAAEKEAQEAQEKYVQDQKDAIAAAGTLAAVNAVISGLDNDRLSATEKGALETEAEGKKKMISDAEVAKEIALIKAAADAGNVDIALEIAKRNPNILPAAKSATGEGSLQMAADDRKTAISNENTRLAGEASSNAVQAAITKINAATTLQQVTEAVNEANANAAILPTEKDKTAEDAGSYQMAAADKRVEISSATQRAALMTAGDKLRADLGIATGAGDAVTQAQIDDAKDALAGLNTAIDNADDVANELKQPYVDQRDTAGIDTLESRLSQVDALKAARSALLAAVKIDEEDALNDDGYFDSDDPFGTFIPTRDELTAIAGLRDALKRLLDDESGDVLDDGPYWNAYSRVAQWWSSNDRNLRVAETNQQNTQNAQDRANAASLHTALDKAFTTDLDKNGNYSGNNNSRFSDDMFNIGTTAIDASNPGLKKTPLSVPALAGWSGAQYTTTDDGEINREAHVYTKKGAAVTGLPFGSATADASEIQGSNTRSPTHKYRYRLVNLSDSSSLGLADFGISGSEIVANRGIMIDSFTQTAGSRKYEKPVGSTASYISEAGSYHGVRGTFYCTGNSCRVHHGGETGQKLGESTAIPEATPSTWYFVPSSANALVTETPAMDLASYGWWLDKSNSAGWSVGVFDASRGAVRQLSNFNLNSGSATYRGGAAGKYALSSSTGGRNEAGHFTASVELMAKFGTGTDDTISGTVSDFKNGQGADIDGEWKVALGESMIAGGAISDSRTTWSVGETAGTAAGSWSGNMWNLGDDGVPDIVTGTFNAHLGNDGRMAGAFGADHTATP